MAGDDLGVLYSGGKDSALAALLLDGFYDVTLVTARFGITDDWKHARETAKRSRFEFERLDLDRAVAENAVERMLEDGYPRNGIQEVHEHALERIATEGFETVADGTRRDDRVPSIPRNQAQSLEDRHDIEYVAPLAGFGRDAVDHLAAETLAVEIGPSEDIDRADYEAELRTLLAKRAGSDAVAEIFPDHEQTAVVGFPSR